MTLHCTRSIDGRAEPSIYGKCVYVHFIIMTIHESHDHPDLCLPSNQPAIMWIAMTEARHIRRKKTVSNIHAMQMISKSALCSKTLACSMLVGAAPATC